MKIQDESLYLFRQKHFAQLATVNPDGSPQVTPVWIDYDEDKELIIVNTAKGRKKARNLMIGSKVALSISDVNDPYRYISIQGDVEEVTEENALDHIIKLAYRYFDRDFERAEGEIRIKIFIRAKHIYSS